MQRVVVTGASGFIGRHCIPVLHRMGFEVHALSRTKTGVDSNLTHWHQLDLLTEDAFPVLSAIRPTHFLHLTWYTVHGKFWTASENQIWLEKSKVLVQQFVEAGGMRWVSSGTCAEYDWQSPSPYVENVSIEKPNTVYGLAKKSFSDFLISISENRPLSTANGRIFFIYGPHESFSKLIPSVVSSALKNEVVTCSDGKQLRDFIYVEDVAQALCALLASNVEGNVNIGSGEARSVQSIIETIVAQTDSSSSIQWGAFSRPKIDPDLICASIQRLKNEVGFVPKITLDEGLDLTIQWVKVLLKS